MYPTKYLEQFGVVISPFRPWKYWGDLPVGQPCLNRHFGVRWGEAVLECDVPASRAVHNSSKEQDISVICSGKTLAGQQRRRLAFVDALKTRFGDKLIHFAAGFSLISDNADAIPPFKYHLVLENNTIPHFWTEKLADACLGFAMPLFSSCANLAEYSPEQSLIELNLDNIPESIKRVCAVLDEDPYDRMLQSIIGARRRVIDEYNLFAVLDRIGADLPPLRPVAPLRVEPAAAVAAQIGKTAFSSYRKGVSDNYGNAYVDKRQMAGVMHGVF